MEELDPKRPEGELYEFNVTGISIGLLVAAIVMFLVLFIRTMLEGKLFDERTLKLSSRMDGQATWINNE